MKLYELSEAYANVYELLADDSDEMSEEEYKDGIALLEEIEANLHDKLLACARVSKQLEAEAKIIRNEEQRLAARRKAIENNKDRLAKYMLDNMQEAGLEKAADATFTVSMQNNPPSVRMLNIKELPKDYLIEQEPKIDKRGILSDIKAGKEVPGAELEQSKGLRIR